MLLSKENAKVLDSLLDRVDIDLRGKVKPITYANAANNLNMTVTDYLRCLDELRSKKVIKFDYDGKHRSGLTVNMDYFPTLSVQAVFESPFFQIES